MRTILITIIALSILSSNAIAADYCFDRAAAKYNISPALLWAISKNESGHSPNAYNKNSNGSYDYCHMQINSVWYKTLGPDRWAALSDPCQCTMTGAWILKRCINKYGYTWEAVGCYHSQTPDKRDRYARRVANIIFNSSNVAMQQREKQARN